MVEVEPGGMSGSAREVEIAQEAPGAQVAFRPLRRPRNDVLAGSVCVIKAQAAKGCDPQGLLFGLGGGVSRTELVPEFPYLRRATRCLGHDMHGGLLGSAYSLFATEESSRASLKSSASSGSIQ